MGPSCGSSRTANAFNALGGPGVLTSGSPVVFVDDAAEDVAPADLAGAWLVVARRWGRKPASAVRASLVVVADVVGEHRL